MSELTTHGTDAGYFFLGSAVLTRTKTLQNGIKLDAYKKNGVTVSDNPHSPWYQATLFVQGTTVTGLGGELVQDVALYESTDSDGDLTWSVLWLPAGGAVTLQFVVGTGKWEGISGQGELSGFVRSRADDMTMPRWMINWMVKKEIEQNLDAPLETEKYTDHDRGLSFHGPHIAEFTRNLTNGISLLVSNQSGVLLSEDPDARSPRNFATNFDRGTTILHNGKTLGDVMLLEDTDPDGDVVWLVHIWWYGKGPGTYQFIGGTGKWKGICGEGRTLGMLRSRKDDHYMLKSEMHWKIDAEK